MHFVCEIFALFVIPFSMFAVCILPRVPEVFLACGDYKDWTCDNQYGFRKNRSLASRLLICVIKFLLLLIEHAIGVFLDLSNAFDTVNHVILFDKLEHYGIRGLALEWVKNYFFSERKQFVEFNNVRSSLQGISCGVPQGSILGPSFFILYVNDLNNASMLDAILFADDTNLFISHNDPVYLINTLNRE